MTYPNKRSSHSKPEDRHLTHSKIVAARQPGNRDGRTLNQGKKKREGENGKRERKEEKEIIHFLTNERIKERRSGNDIFIEKQKEKGRFPRRGYIIKP